MDTRKVTEWTKILNWIIEQLHIQEEIIEDYRKDCNECKSYEKWKILRTLQAYHRGRAESYMEVINKLSDYFVPP